MGESLLESPTKVENEMDGSGTDQDQVGNGGTGELQVSVSFGKYENESLSWEKWSAFPTNKYLEEVEKCSTPGSVAQKKAYFEAHYKRIAARKSAEQQQPLQVVHGKKEGNEFSDVQQVSVEDQTTQVSTGNNCVDELDVGKSVVEDAVITFDAEYRNEGGSEIGDACVNEASFDGDVDVEQRNNPQLVVEDAEDRSGSRPDSPKSNKAEELVFIKEEAPSLGSLDMEECQPDSNPDKGTGPVANQAIRELQQDVDSSRESTQVQKQEKVKPETPKRQQKVSATKKPSTAADAKKKPDSPSPRPMFIPKTAKPAQSKSDMSIPKTAKPVLSRSAVSSGKAPKSVVSSTKTAKPAPPKSVLSSPKTAKPVPPKSVVSSPKTEKPLLSYSVMCTPKTAKPALSKSVMSTTRSLVKKENSSTSLITNKKTTKTESKRMGPTSLHISMSIGPAKSESAASLPETRKSLFMESMGDKEIVRRAFKTFQNRYSQQASSGLRRPSSAGTQMQASKKERETGGSPLDTSQKKSEGAAKASRRSPLSSGYNLQSLNGKSSKAVGADQRHMGTFSPYFVSRGLDRVEKPKELSKKSEEKWNSKLAAETQPQARPKGQKSEDTKQLGQSLDLSSKPTAASYQRPRV